MGRKGFGIDGLFLTTAVILALGVGILMAAYLRDALWSGIGPMINGSATVANIQKSSIFHIGVLDYIFASSYVLLALVSMVSAYMVRNNPIFIIISIVLVLAQFLLAPTISNVMRAIWVQPQFAGYAPGGGGSVEFPLMSAFFQYLPYVSGIFAVLTMIVSFSKGEESQGM